MSFGGRHERGGVCLAVLLMVSEELGFHLAFISNSANTDRTYRTSHRIPGTEMNVRSFQKLIVYIQTQQDHEQQTELGLQCFL